MARTLDSSLGIVGGMDPHAVRRRRISNLVRDYDLEDLLVRLPLHKKYDFLHEVSEQSELDLMPAEIKRKVFRDVLWCWGRLIQFE